MVCEDGNGAQHVFGVTRRGEVYGLARNRQAITSAAAAAGGTPQAPKYGEFAGVTFSPDGGVDLEDEAVIPGAAGGAGPVLGLLAGQPGAPGVGPPAQLTAVPEMATRSQRTWTPASRVSAVQPPLAVGS